MIFHFMAAQKLVAEHYKISFLHDIPFKCSSKLGCKHTKHYIIEFCMIFHYKAAQNLAAEHYERDFDFIFRLEADQNLVVEHCE